VARFKGGTSVLRLACAGPGSVRAVAVSLGPDGGPESPAEGPVLADRTLRCTPEGATDVVPVTIPRNSGVAVRFTPDDMARDEAGYAVTMSPG
jgi:hypothetical protein